VLPYPERGGEARFPEACNEASGEGAERATRSEGAGAISRAVDVAKGIGGLILYRPVVTIDAHLPRAPHAWSGATATARRDAPLLRVAGVAETARRARPADAASTPTCVARRARIPIAAGDPVGCRVPDAGAKTVAAARPAQIDRGAAWRSSWHGRTRSAGPVGADVSNGALVGVIARAAPRRMHAVTRAVADVVRTDIPVVGTSGARVFWLARRRAAVPVEDIAVVAFFAGVEDAVPAVAAEERPARGEGPETVEGAREAGPVRGNTAIDREARTEGLGVAARCERTRRGIDRTGEGHLSDDRTGAGDGQRRTGLCDVRQAPDRRGRPRGGLGAHTPFAAEVRSAKGDVGGAEQDREMYGHHPHVGEPTARISGGSMCPGGSALLGEVERLRAVRWARLARDATDDDDEGDHAVVYFAEPISSGYVLIQREQLAKRDQRGARAVEAGAPRVLPQLRHRVGALRTADGSLGNCNRAPGVRGAVGCRPDADRANLRGDEQLQGRRGRRKRQGRDSRPGARANHAASLRLTNVGGCPSSVAARPAGQSRRVDVLMMHR